MSPPCAWLSSATSQRNAAEIGEQRPCSSYAALFGLTLALVTTLSIGRSPWAVALELLCLLGLILLVAQERPSAPLPSWVAPGSALGAGLVVQANLLRWFGPPGTLDLGELLHMRFTALISLLWATLGALMTLWGCKRGSRPLWVGGAALMVAAAVKFVLVDFGALGQLANILAVIAAGIVFLLVGWLAPMPAAATPKSPTADKHSGPVIAKGTRQAQMPPASHERVPSSRPVTASVPAAAREPPRDISQASARTSEYWERNRNPGSPTAIARGHDSGPVIAWTVAILAVLVLPLGPARHRRSGVHTRILGRPTATQVAYTAPSPAPMQSQPTTPQQVSPSNPDSTSTDGAGDEPATPVATSKTADCERWVAGLPADYVIYSAGARQAPPATRDPAGAPRMGRFNVTVHQSNRNVVLLLGAYDTAEWDVRWGAATHVVAVWISGYSPQFVAGLSSNVALMRTSFGDRGPGCPWFAVASGDAPDGSGAALQIMRHGVDATFPAHGSQIEIGSSTDAVLNLPSSRPAPDSTKITIRSALYASPPQWPVVM